MKPTLCLVLIALTVCAASRADETSALVTLQQKAARPKILKDKSGRITELSLDAPNLSNTDLALFNEFKELRKLTISHAGYSGGKKTGVDFSGVAALKDHPTLEYFSAGGDIGKEYLAALPALTNVRELYIQTTQSLDADWAPIGTMKHLTYLGVRVRNDRMSKLTDEFFAHLMPLENLETFLLSEMTFTDPGSFVKFITTRPKLKDLKIKSSPTLSETALNDIRKAKPGLKITITGGKEK